MLSLHQWHRPPLHSIYKAYIYSIECMELQEAGKGRQLGAAHQIQQRFPPPKIQKYKTCYFFSTYHISWDTTDRNYVCYHEQFNILNFQNINNLKISQTKLCKICQKGKNPWVYGIQMNSLEWDFQNNFTCVLCQITEALECPSLFLHGPLS